VIELEPRVVANNHWRSFYRGLVESMGGEWRRFGNVDAFSTPNLPAPFANGVLAIEPSTPSDVAAATEWTRGPGVPFRVRIDTALGDDVLQVPHDLGLERDEWTMPGMILTPVPPPPATAPGVAAERVVAANFEDFIQATVDCGMPRPIAEQSFDLRATESGDSTSSWAGWTAVRRERRRSSEPTTSAASTPWRPSRAHGGVALEPR
jgi:hypothetical protein